MQKIQNPLFIVFEGRHDEGLVCDGGCKLDSIDGFFITGDPIDLHLVGSGSYVMPLYIYKTARSLRILSQAGITI